MSSSSPEPVIEKASKRKRDIVPDDDGEKLEIDVSLPEPPSKKAKRKEKKLSKKPKTTKATARSDDANGTTVEAEQEEEAESALAAKPAAPAKRSEYGIWIGNLTFKVTKDSLRQFFLNQGGIDEDSITRLHMPTGDKGQNKGFAYVDFSTQAVLEIALALSEKLVAGRRCLIKNAHSFEGRPAKTEKEAEVEKAGGYVSKKEPSKRVFVGNLSFDITKDELAEHFGQAGKVDDLFLATFEDSGKCKGFGWVTFTELEAAEQAVRGFIFKKPEDQGDDDEVNEESESDEDNATAGAKKKKAKAKKPRKWFINRIHGRLLRCEFAEDPQTRYKKRFGKDPSTAAPKNLRASPSYEPASGPNGKSMRASPSYESAAPGAEAGVKAARRDSAPKKEGKPKLDKEERREVRRKRHQSHDARNVAPGKALANAQRATGAIVAGAGSKTTFD
jgi:RNA recognition motif-containing protein